MTVTRYNGTCPVCYHHQRLRTMNTRTWPREMLKEDLHLLPESKMGMVHHGYRRPGHGEIIGDCYGVGWPPWESTPNGNIAYVSHVLISELETTQHHLSQLESGEVREFRIRPRRGRWDAPVIVIKLGDERRYEGNEWQDSFQEKLQSEINRATQKIRWLTQDIGERQKLIAEWQQQPLETEEEEQQKRQRMSDERRAVIDAAREAKRQKRAALDAKEQARRDENLALMAEYRDIFNTLAFRMTESEPWQQAGVKEEAKQHWIKMHRRKSKKTYLDFYERHLGIDQALEALGLAKPETRREGYYVYSNDLGWEPVVY